MWEMINMTPYKASAVVLRDRNGKAILVVAVKGTFAIGNDGATRLVKDQLEPVLLPKFCGDPAASSLECDTDLLPTKPTTDVLLHGHAYGPGGRPVEQVDVNMVVGPVRKSLRVHGDRVVKRGRLVTTAAETERFQKMPIVYERAYGGMIKDAKARHGLVGDARNPAGIGFDTGSEVIGGRLPNIAYASATGSGRAPAGFGPVARHWSPRRELAGTYDERWRQERMPLPPDDFQDAFYQCAPRDQQCPSYLEGGEEVKLENLTPSGRLSFSLPRVRLAIGAAIARSVDEERPRLHTVLLYPDLPCVSLVWHCLFSCQNKENKIREISVWEKSHVGPVAPMLPG